MKFEEKLVILRKSKGLTQDDFASAIGVSRQAVYKWESGQSYPEVPKLLEMKLLFTISIDELLDDNYDLPLPDKKKKKRAPKTDAAPKAAKVVAPKAPAAPKPEATPAPKVAPAPVAPAAPKPEAAPAPKVAPAPVAPAAPKPEAAPAPKVAPAPVAPVAPKPEAAPAPKVAPAPVAPVAPKPEAAPAPKIDTVPSPEEIENTSPITLEDLEADEPAKKGNFFERLFGRK